MFVRWTIEIKCAMPPFRVLLRVEIPLDRVLPPFLVPARVETTFVHVIPLLTAPSQHISLWERYEDKNQSNLSKHFKSGRWNLKQIDEYRTFPSAIYIYISSHLWKWAIDEPARTESQNRPNTYLLKNLAKEKLHRKSYIFTLCS